MRDALVTFTNLNFDGCIFSSSSLLRDIYTDFEPPYKKIYVNNITFTNT